MLIPLILLAIWAVPSGIDVAAGDSIDANSFSALQELEFVGELFTFKPLRDKDALIKERLEDVRNSKSEKAVARALVNLQDEVEEEDQVLVDQREQALGAARQKLQERGNNRAVEAIDLALSRGRNQHAQENQSNNSQTAH